MSEGESDASAEETALLMAFLLFLKADIIPLSSWFEEKAEIDRF